MSKFILGKKLEMTQKFAQDGRVIAVTKVLAGPCFVTQIKKVEKDKYAAVQLGFESKKNVSKPVKGHLKNLGPFKYLKEFRVENGDLKRGQEIKANIFNNEDIVHVTGISKGKGFQGVVKRWGFHGSPASHGHKDQLRMTGSIGATGEARVKKGKKMPGRMGTDQVTVKNLKIIDVDYEKNILFIKGAIPGRRKGLILIAGPGEIKIEEKLSEEVNKFDKVEAKSEEKKEVKQDVEKAKVEAKKTEIKSEVKKVEQTEKVEDKNKKE